MYHPPTNLREGNVFTGVCHTVQGGVCMPGPMSLLGDVHDWSSQVLSGVGGGGGDWAHQRRWWRLTVYQRGWVYVYPPPRHGTWDIHPPRLVLATTTHTVEVVIETALWLLICNSQSQQTASTSPNERNAQHLNDWWVEEPADSSTPEECRVEESKNM